MNYLSEHSIEKLNKGYTNYYPFPHILIDDFLQDHIINQITKDVKKLDNYAPLLEYTIENTEPNSVDKKLEHRYNYDKTLTELIKYLFSDEFITYLENLTGIKDIIRNNIDLLGAGIHKIKNEGYLSIHTDFNMTTSSNNELLDRRVNLLIYLNEDWKYDYNGHLMLCDKNKKKICYKISPILNRCVIFNTTNKSLHGHPEKLNLPEGKMRESIALYYYTKNDGSMRDFEGDESHMTIWYDYSEFDKYNFINL